MRLHRCAFLMTSAAPVIRLRKNGAAGPLPEQAVFRVFRNLLGEVDVVNHAGLACTFEQLKQRGTFVRSCPAADHDDDGVAAQH